MYVCTTVYSRISLTRTLVIRIANYPDRLSLTVIVLPFYGLNFSPICQIHIKNYVLMFYLYVNKYVT